MNRLDHEAGVFCSNGPLGFTSPIFTGPGEIDYTGAALASPG
jgi:hypothetical protein